jgi:hypothetical protein
MASPKKPDPWIADAAKDGALGGAQSLATGAGITAAVATGVATGAVSAVTRLGLALFGRAIQLQSEHKFEQLMTGIAIELKYGDVAETEARILRMIGICQWV